MRPPLTVHQPTPLPPLRHYIDRTITVTPDDMDLVVGEPPVYDPTKLQEQELARWIAWSAKKQMAKALEDVWSGKIRASDQAKS